MSKKRKPQTLSKFAQRYEAARQPKQQPLVFTKAQWKELNELYHKAYPQAPKLNLP